MLGRFAGVGTVAEIGARRVALTAAAGGLLVAAAVAHGVRRFVHVSSIVAYGNAAVGEIDEEL